MISQPRSRASVRRIPVWAFLISGVALPGLARDLTFEERILAQEAIERVYYGYQLSATEPFEAAVPRELLERKVRAYLAESDAVERARGAALTAEMLRAELRRIEMSTRLPDRLREVYEALGDDPQLLEECLARPVLVSRLSRSVASGAGTLAEAGLVAPESTCIPGEGWQLIPSAAPRDQHTAVWTGSLMIIWGGLDSSHSLANTGARYDPVVDQWTPTAIAGAPSGRQWHTAVWTGGRMIVWGGQDASGDSDTGGRYDPISNAWSPVATAQAPSARSLHGAVWTGAEMLVWGGQGNTVLRTGGRYDPVSDTWERMSTTGAPEGRLFPTAVWAGSQMLVWGGFAGEGVVGTGGRYRPATDSWSAMSGVGAPAARYLHSLVWTGQEAIVWGGSSGDPLATGGRYDPAADTWTPTASAHAPGARSNPLGLWTGSVMLILGGYQAPDYGGQYEPAGDRWVPVAASGSGGPALRATAVWTGASVLVVGGSVSASPVGTAREYLPGEPVDGDGDGFLRCGDDCNDGNPLTHDGAVEACDGWDNDCNGAVPGAESDVDGDGFRGCQECDDSNPARFPGNAETCDNLDNDCDEVVDGMPTQCGVGGCVRAGLCSSGVDSCVPGAPVPESCNGIDDDCNGSLPPGEADADGDGSPVCVDCDDGNPAVYPGDVERNDGLDNQCPGASGHGLVDEISGISGFTDAADPNRFCWVPQLGAGAYEVVRAAAATFSDGCEVTPTSSACLTDPETPASRGAYYYLVRAASPYVGSFGAGSSGEERQDLCGP